MPGSTRYDVGNDHTCRCLVYDSTLSTGQAVVAYCVLRESHRDDHTPDEAEVLLKAHVAKEIGAIARPRQIYIVNELPKTRSGKIMRRLLQDVAEGREVGDTSTLADSAVMQVIKQSRR